jgi:hypothetical protein
VANIPSGLSLTPAQETKEFAVSETAKNCGNYAKPLIWHLILKVHVKFGIAGVYRQDEIFMERNVLENRAESQYLVKRPQSGLNTKAY